MSEWFATHSTTQEMRELKKREEDHETSQRVAQQRDKANQRNAASMSQQNDPAAKKIGTAEGHGSLASSVMLIPAGLEVVPNRPQNPAQNIDREKSNLVDAICGAMGVPNSLIHPASSTYNSGGLVQRIINAEMNKQAKYIKSLFTVAYTAAYGNDAQTRETQKIKRQKKKKKRKTEQSRPQGEEDADEKRETRTKNKNQTQTQTHQQDEKQQENGATTCYIVFPPFLEVETLLAVAAQRLFKNQYIGTLLAQGAGFFEQGQTEKFILPEETLQQQDQAPQKKTTVDTQTHKHNQKAQARALDSAKKTE